MGLLKCVSFNSSRSISLVMFISKRLEKIKAPWSSQSPGDALPLSQTIATSQIWKQFWKESTQVVVNDASKNSRPTRRIVNKPVVHKIIPHGNAPLENLESETHWHWFRVCDVRVGCHTQHILNIIIGWTWLFNFATFSHFVALAEMLMSWRREPSQLNLFFSSPTSPAWKIRTETWDFAFFSFVVWNAKFLKPLVMARISCLKNRPWQW